jgi:hypothetical protein
MRAVSRFLQIHFADGLTTPTLNGMPIKANSSYRVKRFSTIEDATNRYRQVLDKAQIAEIDRVARERYEILATVADKSIGASKKNAASGDGVKVGGAETG